ncbi:hypothetical protein [Nocardia sp. CA-120079]|uniref:hypothetical protein n=1 Tax=Nocardia sp. CA-120079 TaxID=3239974 RepID=UPI003D96A1B1
MRGFITDPVACGGLRLTGDLPEPDPAADEVVVAVRAYAVNHDEANLIARRWRWLATWSGRRWCGGAGGCEWQRSGPTGDRFLISGTSETPCRAADLRRYRFRYRLSATSVLDRWIGAVLSCRHDKDR